MPAPRPLFSARVARPGQLRGVKLFRVGVMLVPDQMDPRLVAALAASGAHHGRAVRKALVASVGAEIIRRLNLSAHKAGEARALAASFQKLHMVPRELQTHRCQLG